MKRVILLLLAVFASSITQSIRAGDPATLDPFHSIVVSSEIEAELVLSKQEAIETEFKNASVEDLIVEVVNSVLKIRMRTGTYKDAILKVRVHYTKDLKHLEADGRAQIWSEEDLYFEGDLDVRLSNGGEMRFTLYCDSLSAVLSQGSVIYLTGKARALDLKVTTGATFSGYEFETRIARAVASGAGKAKISVSEYLDAKASFKGFIGYVGDPEKTDEKTSLKGEILKTVLE